MRWKTGEDRQTRPDGPRSSHPLCCVPRPASSRANPPIPPPELCGEVAEPCLCSPMYLGTYMPCPDKQEESRREVFNSGLGLFLDAEEHTYHPHHTCLSSFRRLGRQTDSRGDPLIRRGERSISKDETRGDDDWLTTPHQEIRPAFRMRTRGSPRPGCGLLKRSRAGLDPGDSIRRPPAVEPGIPNSQNSESLLVRKNQAAPALTRTPRADGRSFAGATVAAAARCSLVD